MGTISFPFNELGALIEYGAVPEYGHITDVENAVKLKSYPHLRPTLITNVCNGNTTSFIIIPAGDLSVNSDAPIPSK